MTFADGGRVGVATVVWATGFAVDHSWIDVPVFDADGAVIQLRGVTPAPGFYFAGLPWMHSRGSALLGWVGHDDAAHVAERIRAHATRTQGDSYGSCPDVAEPEREDAVHA